MCRLLGYAATRAATTEEVLGDQRHVFADMARLHRDGWGTAWRTAAGAIEAQVSATGGWRDEQLRDVLDHDAAAARIVHLRLASAGMVRGRRNTHPFLRDGFAFAHNGALRPFGALDALISRRRAAELTGTTDSERYFAAVLSRVDEGRAPIDAVQETASALRDAYPGSSLNALLLTPDELIAVHASRDVAVPHEELAASGLRPEELPAHHLDAYYVMRLRRFGDRAVAVASSGLDVEGWDPLPPESVTAVSSASLAARTVPLDAARLDAGAAEADVA